jgi:hypothetical protein
MSKQTAVEYLIEEYKKAFKIPVNAVMQEAIEQALAMEKSQIIKTYRDGRSDQQSERNTRWYNRNAEYYYNEKFKGGHNE